MDLPAGNESSNSGVDPKRGLIKKLVDSRRQLLERIEKGAPFDKCHDTTQRTSQEELDATESQLRELTGTVTPDMSLYETEGKEHQPDEDGKDESRLFVESSNIPPHQASQATVNGHDNTGITAGNDDDDDDDFSIAEVRTVSHHDEHNNYSAPSSSQTATNGYVPPQDPPKRSYSSLFPNSNNSPASSAVVDLTNEDDDIEILGPAEKKPRNDTLQEGSRSLYNDRTVQILNLFKSNTVPRLPNDQASAAIRAWNQLQTTFTNTLKKILSLEKTRVSQKDRIMAVEKKARGEPSNSETNMSLHSLAKSLELTNRQLAKVREEVTKVEKQIELFFSPTSQQRDFKVMLDLLHRGYYDNYSVLFGTQGNNNNNNNAYQQQQQLQQQQRQYQFDQRHVAQQQRHTAPVNNRQQQGFTSSASSSSTVDNTRLLEQWARGDLVDIDDDEYSDEEDRYRFGGGRRGGDIASLFSNSSSSSGYNMRTSHYDVDLRELLDSIPWDSGKATEDRTGTPEQLKVNLLEHQKAGLSWLQKQEEKRGGGILADDMGLGKTIQMLALMVSRPPEGEDKVKTNLVIAPVALLRQWEREIKVRLKKQYQLSVYVHHSSSKTMHRNWDKMKEFDVVITTYGLISREYKEHFALGIESANTSKDDTPTASNENSDNPNSNNQDNYKNSAFYIGKWHRVILDEAQFIKNKATLSAKACSALEATNRWCLSGTPMQNKVEELYSLIRFLRIKPYNDEQKFSQDIGAGIKRGSDQAIEKLRVLLKVILLRRTKSTEIDGKPILSLPPRIVELETNSFDNEETSFYKELENQTASKMNSFLKSKSINKNYSSILVLLLRLRQACCHPKLIDLSEIRRRERLAKEAAPNALKAARKLKRDVVSRIAEQKSFVCPVCYDGYEADGVLLTVCGHHICAECSPGFFAESRRKLMEQGEDGKTNPANCPLCKEEIFEDQMIDYETFYLVHVKHLTDPEINSTRKKEKKQQREEKKRLQETIKARREALQKQKDANGDNDYDEGDGGQEDQPEDPSKVLGELFSPDSSDDDYEDSDSEKDTKKDIKGKNVDWNDGDLVVQQLGMDYLFSDGWVSSTKIEKCMELVKRIEVDYPGEKIIIFSQFTSLLDILDIPLVKEGYDYLRYDGSMSATERNETVMEFFDNPDKRLMLVSLKAGNVGLTLTSASHVIIMDPFWNPYIEEQAIDRTHRIGQELPVHVHRLVIKDSVEDRILKLQDEKRKMIDAALEEGGQHGATRLDQNQLLYLFGLRPAPNSDSSATTTT